MKTLKKLFLFGILATFSLSACDLLEGLIDSDNQDKISETLIKQHIQGTWEVTHVSGYEERWNDNLQKHEIFPIDRDVHISPDDHWSSRIKLSNGKATLYGYAEYGWASQGQTDYSVEDNKLIIIFTENGNEERMEFKVQYIDNKKLVLSSPLQSDPSKATIVTTKRVDDEQGEGVSEALIRQHIQGTWEVTHISGYVEQWNDRTQKEEIVPVDRDTHPSPEDYWCFRAKFTADQMTFYAYMRYGWTPTEQHNYTVEGDKIVVIWEENGQQERWETKVLHIDNDNLVFASPILSDPSKATIITAKRVEEEQGDEVPEALIRQHIQGTWEVTHISGYVEEWNDNTQMHEIIPIDRDAHPSPEDHWCFRAKFTAEQMTYYAYLQYGWTPTEQHNYTVEGDKIVVIFSENGHQERWETKVLHIDNDNLVFAMPIWSDPSKETIIITKRVEDVPDSEVTEALIRQHIQGTWEVTHISGYVEEWNDNTQQHEIIPIDRDAHPSPEDHWCFRARFTADQMTYYAYLQYGWTPTEQHNYTVEGNKIVVIFSDNGQQERWETKVLHIDNDNLVFAMPIWSDPSKARVLTTKRIE
jgi:uncharacterized protein YrzB (UPF0473 family)